MSLFTRLASFVANAKEAKSSLIKARDSARQIQKTAREARAAAVQRNQTKADQGNADAQFILGERYYDGLGVPRDYAESARWFRKAADQGHSKAQCNLGIMHFLGRGVPQDYLEAYKWIELAGRGGYPGAAKARATLIKRMTPEQIAEGQHRADEFRPPT
ncbi:MAG: sel1 repeat family protein [Candidatus Omnitrophica bacterium]|nr:sel1 repeat family protein [Candidatus Omnitrophota bacterium]